MFTPLKSIIDLDYNKITMNQALRIFTTNKKYLVLCPHGGFHLTNKPKRIVMENYKLDEAYNIEIYEL